MLNQPGLAAAPSGLFRISVCSRAQVLPRSGRARDGRAGPPFATRWRGRGSARPEQHAGAGHRAGGEEAPTGPPRRALLRCPDGVGRKFVPVAHEYPPRAEGWPPPPLELALIVNVHSGVVKILFLTSPRARRPRPRIEATTVSEPSRMARLRQIVVDCDTPSSLARFWAAALDGFGVRPYDDAEIARLAALGLTPETDPASSSTGPTSRSAFRRSSWSGGRRRRCTSTSTRRTGTPRSSASSPSAPPSRSGSMATRGCSIPRATTSAS